MVDVERTCGLFYIRKRYLKPYQTLERNGTGTIRNMQRSMKNEMNKNEFHLWENYAQICAEKSQTMLFIVYSKSLFLIILLVVISWTDLLNYILVFGRLYI